MRVRIQLFILMLIRIQGARPIRIHADLDPGRTLKSQKVEFLHLKYQVYFKNVGNTINIPTNTINIPYLFERRETRFTVFVNFGQFPCSWIQIRLMYCQLNFFLNLFSTDNSPDKITHRRPLFESGGFFYIFWVG